jgi:hypothetical protein
MDAASYSHIPIEFLRAFPNESRTVYTVYFKPKMAESELKYFHGYRDIMGSWPPYVITVAAIPDNDKAIKAIKASNLKDFYVEMDKYPYKVTDVTWRSVRVSDPHWASRLATMLLPDVDTIHGHSSYIAPSDGTLISSFEYQHIEKGNDKIESYTFNFSGTDHGKSGSRISLGYLDYWQFFEVSEDDQNHYYRLKGKQISPF